MRKLFGVLSVLICAFSLVMFSCGGGGGGAGGTAASTTSSNLSASGASAVSIQFNGLYARSYGSVWDTIDYLDLKIFVDGAEVFSKHLTASDNIVLVEHLTPGSTAYATGTLRYNEMNDGAEGNIVSDPITLETGSNTLTLNVVYTYKLLDDNNELITAGTYTAASGIPVSDNIRIAGDNILTGWYYDPDFTAPADMNGIRGNVVLYGKYERNPDYFEIMIPEIWNKYIWLGTIDNDAINYPNYCALVEISVSGVSNTSELSCAKISGSGVVEPIFEETCIKLKAVNLGPATYRISRGSYYKDVELTVGSMMELDGDFSDNGNVTVKRFLVPEGAPAGTTFVYYIGHAAANWHCSIASDAVDAEVRDCIRSLYMGESNMTTIPDACFSNCTALSYIVLPASLQIIGNSAFANCNSLGAGPSAAHSCGCTRAQWNAIGEQGGWGGLENINALYISLPNETITLYSDGTAWYEF